MTKPRTSTDTPSTPLAWTAVGVMASMIALVALVVAGSAAADLFPVSGTATQAAADRGVWMATQAWATPIGLAGLGVLFGLAIPAALRNVTAAIDHRRTAMVTNLPTLIQGAVR